MFSWIPKPQNSQRGEIKNILIYFLSEISTRVLFLSEKGLQGSTKKSLFTFTFHFYTYIGLFTNRPGKPHLVHTGSLGI